MRRHRIWYGIVLLISILLHLMANRGETAAFLGILVFLPLLSGSLQVMAVCSAKVTFEIPERCMVDRKIPLHIHFRRSNRIPMGVMDVTFELYNRMYGERRELKLRLIPSEKAAMKYEYPIRWEDCGAVRLSVKSVRYYDLAGLFAGSEEPEEERELLIYPAPVKVCIDLKRRPETQISGEYYDPSRKGQDVSEVADIRDYKEGDSLGSIHWKLSGKFDHLVVREFGYPSNYQVLVLCDMRRGTDGHPISRLRNTEVLAMTVSLSQALLEVNLEHHVGYLMNGDIETVPVDSLETHEQMMLNLLSKEPEEEQNRLSIYDWVRKNHLRQQYTKLIYITPEYEEKTVQRLSGELDVTVVQIAEEAAEHFVEHHNYEVIVAEAADCKENEYHISI